MKVKLGGNFNEVPDSAPAPIGLYTGKVAAVDERPSNAGEPMIEVRWELVADAKGKGLKDPKTGKKAAYDPVFTYHPLDPDASWARRMKELLTALGVKLTGTVDIKNGSKALLRLKDGEDQDGNYRPNVSKIMKLGAAPADDEDEDEDETEEAEDEEAEGEEEEETVDLDSLSRAEMKQFIKDNELGIRVLTKDDDDTLREKIKAALPEEEEEEEEEEESEEEEEEEEDTVDLSELDRNELKAFIKENNLEVKVLKKDSDDDVRSKIAEALPDGDDEEEEEESDEDGDNYDELSPDQLKQECKDRELSDKGKKSALIARLRKDDAEEPV